MENLTGIKDRILQIPDTLGITKEKFFKKINLSYANFRGKSKKSALSSNALVEISTIYPKVNVEWLLTGKGPMLKPGPSDFENKKPEPDVLKQKDMHIADLRERITELKERIGELNRHIDNLETLLKNREHQKSKKKSADQHARNRT